jgi:hypothetical protein
MDKIERMWALGELPPSTQHASAPPTEAFVISCVRDLRTVFGEDIHWATATAYGLHWQMQLVGTVKELVLMQRQNKTFTLPTIGYLLFRCIC